MIQIKAEKLEQWLNKTITNNWKYLVGSFLIIAGVVLGYTATIVLIELTPEQVMWTSIYEETLLAEIISVFLILSGGHLILNKLSSKYKLMNKFYVNVFEKY